MPRERTLPSCVDFSSLSTYAVSVQVAVGSVPEELLPVIFWALIKSVEEIPSVCACSWSPAWAASLT